MTRSLQTGSLQHVQTAWRQDRPDIQFAEKELCMVMAMPTVEAWKQLKRLGRCVVRLPRKKEHLGWAGCRRTADPPVVAAVKLCGDCIGLTQLAADWNFPSVGHVDSPAAIGIANRKGNGKFHHVKVGMLLIQESVVEGEMILWKVKGENNVTDILTKNAGVATLESACKVHDHDLPTWPN